MKLLIIIFIAVLVATAIAISIVKYLPLKHRWTASLGLTILSIFLVYKIYSGIMEPINFDKDKIERYSKVVKNLKIIRDAQINYFKVKGKYTKDKQELIKLIDNEKIAITETVTIVKKENRGGGIIIDVEEKKIDTIGYEPVLKYFENRDYKNMFKVPGVRGKEFDIELGFVEKIQGLLVPTFYIKTEKRHVLKGMDESLLKEELEAIATDQIKGEFISVGSLDEVTTGGNWPPFYDKK